MLKNDPSLLSLKEALKGQRESITGTVKYIGRPFGFLDLPDSSQSLFIPPQHMSRLRHGDTVCGHSEEDNGRSYFVPQRIVCQKNSQFTARIVHIAEAGYWVKALAKIDDNQYFLPSVNKVDLGIGDYILVDIEVHPFNGEPQVTFVDFVAGQSDPSAAWKCARSVCGVLDAPQTASGYAIDAYCDLRKDLRHRCFITIDETSTRDMDDALHAELLPGGKICLTVAITDPSPYVMSGKDVDGDARKRGFTSYLPGWTSHMLPQSLSEGVLSLRPGQDNDVICCRMVFGPDGDMQEYEFFFATIQSTAKLSYSNVSSWLKNSSEDLSTPARQAVEEQLRILLKFYEARSSWRDANGIVFPDSADFKFIVKDWQVQGIERSTRRIANKIVEEAMIASNIACGQFLQHHGSLGIFSTHNGFKADRLDEVEQLALSVGDEYTRDYIISFEGYVSLWQRLRKENHSTIEMQLRSLQNRADYSSAPSPHYGLGAPVYATWTSPLRKYGDLINQRMVAAIIGGSGSISDSFDESLPAHISDRLFQTRTCERMVNDHLHYSWLSKQCGSRFTGVISFAAKSGVRIEIDETGSSIFVTSELLVGGAYYDAYLSAIIDADSEYHLGDRVTFQVSAVNVESQQVEVNVCPR